MVVGHVAPEAQVGGAIALIQDGDQITIDAEKGQLHLHVDDATLARRRENWTAPAPKYTRGVAAKYMKEVGSSARGAVTD
jgi:dihydroxy-acid dehydratase